VDKIDWLSRFEQVGSSLRLGMEAQGSTQLIACIDDLLEFLPHCLPAQVNRFQSVLNQILAAQMRKDFLLVADLLEYEMAPLICGLITNSENYK